MKITLSERDKKLLLVLVIVAIICLPYFFVIQPFMDKNTKIEAEIKELRNQKQYLEDLSINEGEYAKASDEIAVMAQELLMRFPSDLPQEASILFINNTEKKIPIRLHQVTFGDDVAAQITSSADAAQIDAVEQETGDVTNDAVVEEVTETVAISGNLSGKSTETKFSFEAGYKEYKDFLEYILNYNDRMVITNMTATYGMDVVSGNFTLKQYAISGDGRPPVNYLEPNLMHGTTNVFLQAAGMGSAEETDEAGEDFFLMLSQPDADVDALIFGKSNDATEETYFYTDKNAQQETTISFEGKDGQYTANYYIGKEAYSEEGISFAKNGSINFEVISSPRASEKDKVETKLNIVNNTDVTLHVNILDDDTENPRVTILEKTGVMVIQGLIE